jgi:hypothetical protein
MGRRTVLLAVVVFALMGGSAVAGSRWLITSTRQIKPSVLKQLRGARGARGNAGAAGKFSASNVTVVQGALVILCQSGLPQLCNSGTGYAACPQGAVAIGGGWDQTSFSQSSVVSENKPSDDDTAWFVGMENHDTSNGESYTPYAVCAK